MPEHVPGWRARSLFLLSLSRSLALIYIYTYYIYIYIIYIYILYIHTHYIYIYSVILLTFMVQALSFEDCLDKLESCGNTVRVQAALEEFRELAQQVCICVCGVEL